MSQFKDLIVLELASVLAGPGVGQFFAELGARVIKVENFRTSGDVTRSWRSADEKTDDRSAYFCSVNWGKQSIAIDLASSDGQILVHQLAALSDIVIASYKPGDAEKLRVDYRTLSARHRELIYGQITGYGFHNQRVGFDAIIQAESGFMWMNGEPGGKSLKIPVALMDVLAGHQLKEALLLAMLEKHSTGMGKFVEVSLIEAAVASLSNQATNYLVAGKSPGKQGSAHPNISPYGDIFLSGDGQEILLAIGTDRQFDQLSNVLGISDIVNSLGLTNNASRVKSRNVLNDVLQKAVGSFQAEALLSTLHREKIPAGVVKTVPEALDDPDIANVLLSRDGIRGIRTYVGGDLSTSSHLLPPPHLGEHTRTILLEMLKISPTDVERLVKNGVVS